MRLSPRRGNSLESYKTSPLKRSIPNDQEIKKQITRSPSQKFEPRQQLSTKKYEKLVTNLSCLDRVEQNELANTFKEIIFIERDIESAKIDLALKSDFNLVDGFRIFDMRGYGFVAS